MGSSSPTGVRPGPPELGAKSPANTDHWWSLTLVQFLQSDSTIHSVLNNELPTLLPFNWCSLMCIYRQLVCPLLFLIWSLPSWFSFKKSYFLMDFPKTLIKNFLMLLIFLVFPSNIASFIPVKWLSNKKIYPSTLQYWVLSNISLQQIMPNLCQWEKPAAMVPKKNGNDQMLLLRIDLIKYAKHLLCEII